jgi:membrane protease YdiL (CAAX protease family)
LSSRHQLALLLGLWWRHMRRRPTRLGDAPRLSGTPTFLLLNLLTIGYMAPLVWRNVAASMERNRAAFAWHVLGIVLIGLGSGAQKAAAALQVRGMRNDAFLDALPLTTLARLGLQLADGSFVVLLTPVIPLAGLQVQGQLGMASAFAAGLLSVLAYVTSFVVGQALVAWARALGPASTARRSGFTAIGLTLLGFALLIAPVGALLDEHPNRITIAITRWWLAGGSGTLALYAAAGVLTLTAYQALLSAQRVGFDHVEPQGPAPRALSGSPTRHALEWHMMLRQGGKALVIAVSVALLLFGQLLLRRAAAATIQVLMPLVAGFTVYLGALQTIGQAGRAARGDLLARPFLAALPLSPHQVTEGKAQALRKFLIPVLLMLALMSGYCALNGATGWVYRLLLALGALYIAVDGAVSIAFLSHGVGVAGVAGGQVSSSFSTQLLLMPLLATVLAIDGWAATVAFIAVVAVTWESKRAAAMSVRWLDDSDDALERETTVWRALLAATGFFAVQAMGLRLLALFEVPAGYTLAIAFGASALVLVLLTWRNAARFERPRFVPSHVGWWALGALAGGASGYLARSLAGVLRGSADAEPSSFSTGEAIAVFVTLVVMAPLAEEYFFRGWLQKAIEKDLPAKAKRWAFALGAFAFALAHVGSYGLPQLVLGLCAGALYAAGGGLWPAILAHAMHNGVVLLWP